MTAITNTQIENVSYRQLLTDIDVLVKKAINEKVPEPKAPDEFITRQDVADTFGVTLPTVHAWDNAGILQSYKIGTRTFYKKSEVLAAATKTKKSLSNK